jgi:lipopolysaccharide transport system permease protein
MAAAFSERFLHYLDLVGYKTYADLRAEASRTYVNYLWWVVDPLLALVIYYLVFEVLFERGGPNFVYVLMIGIVFWRWYAEAIAHGANTIMNNKGLMGQVDVPKWIFPVVCLLTDTTKFAFVFLLLMLFLLASGGAIGPALLAIPLMLLIQLLLIAGLSSLAAALVPFLPDLRYVVSTLLLLQMFLSGVFYQADTIPEQYQGLFFMNPMARLLNEYRVVLIEGRWPDMAGLAYVALLGLALVVLSIWLINRLDKTYPRLN